MIEIMDPVFLNALKFLHSKAKSSEDQLKSLLDDVLGQRVKFTKHSDKKLKSFDSHKSTPEKRPFEKLKQDEASDAKKMKMHTSISLPVSRPSSANSEVQMQSSRAGPPSDSSSTQPSIKQDTNGDDDSESTDIEEENSESGEGGFSLNMGICCTICKNSNSSQSNQLIECQECHSLYHQNCHRPPITEHNNDPRLVWFCVKCNKSMKKLVSKNAKPTTTTASEQTNSTSTSGNSSPILTSKSGQTMTSSASFASAANQGRETALQLLKAKAEKAENTNSTIQPFKRIESKAASSSGSINSINQVKQPVGLAGFAANLNRATAPTLTSTTTNTTTTTTDKTSHIIPNSSSITSSSSSVSSSLNSASAVSTSKQVDKRLQMMKKKQLLKLKK